MLRYLIFVIFGILLFVLLNHKDDFSIGIPTFWTIESRNPDVSAPPSPAYETRDEAQTALVERELDECNFYVQEIDDTGAHIGDPPGLEDVEISERTPPFRVIDSSETEGTDAETMALTPAQLRQELVRNREIGKLYTEVCSRINEMFSEIDESVRKDVTKKIVEAILGFIGESRTPVQIIAGIEVATLIPGMIELPSECAALIIQCLDIPETNDINLTIILNLFESVFDFLKESGATMESAVQLLLQGQEQYHGEAVIDKIMDIIIQLAKAINNLPSIFGEGYIIPMDSNFMNYFLREWLFMGSGEGFATPDSINTYYQFLWIYIKTDGQTLYEIRSQVDARVQIVINSNNFASVVAKLYKGLHGRNFCDDSGD